MGVALVPSALVVVADPTALRLVLVVAVERLAPYAPLLPRWVTLGTVGLLLLVLGATYERRRMQAREAVAWVAQMR